MTEIIIDEDRHVFIQLAEGDPIRVYAAWDGGRGIFMIRAADRATYLGAALQVGLLEYSQPAIPEVLDAEGNVIQEAVPASGDLVPEAGTTITELGPMVLTPAVLDEDGNVVTPAVLDNRWHVNFWLDAEAWHRMRWIEFALAWTLNGQPGQANAEEASVAFAGIELIDPLTVRSPSNVLL